MKNSLLLFLFLFSLPHVRDCFAQNLVPNFSFEDTVACPTAQDQIQYATGWSNYYIGATPDYYNACSPATSFGVPYSIFTHQNAHRDCNAYAALVTFHTPSTNYREFIGIQLSQPLVIGQEYFISFYTVMSEFFLSPTQYGMPSNNIGIRLSTVQYGPGNPCPINNFAHLRSIPVITDSVNWTRISGSIIADSTYDFLIVGNFFDNANTDTLHYNCSSCLNYGSYYLVDDICVSTDSLLCNGGIDELLCSTITGVKENIFNDGITLFPNPTSDILNLSFPTFGDAEVSIYDRLGRRVFSGTVRNQNSLTLNLGAFSPGVYLLKLVSEKDGRVVVRKVVKL